MLNARSLQGAIVLVIGLFLAIWMGLSLVTNQLETLLQLAIAALLATAFFLGRKIWLLLIFFSAANTILLSGFGTTDIGQALFLGFSLLMFLMRRLPLNISFGELEYWILLLVICIMQTYMRNPVGLNVFGGSTVGGRPYIVLVLSILTACVLGNIRVQPGEIKWAMRLTVLGSLIGIPVTILRGGGDGGWLEAGNSGPALGDGNGTTRIGSLNVLSNILSRLMVSYISPLRACIRPLWAMLLLFILASAAVSGYRNAVAGVCLTLLLGLIYRGGFQSLLASLLSVAAALSVLAIINSNFPLPGNVQRALSPFPGTWEDRYIEDGDRSTNWRMEMWKEALLTDKWITNKWIGDGIGMTTTQLRSNETLRYTGKTSSGLLFQQENMLINGSYHSGPVHTIRAVGYVGLVVLLLAMIRVAVYAHRQIQRCRDTEWFPVSLFFCLPLIAQPIYFVLVFGEFQSGVAGTVLGIAMIRLLEKNLPIPAYVTRRRQAYVLQRFGPMAVSEPIRN